MSTSEAERVSGALEQTWSDERRDGAVPRPRRPEGESVVPSTAVAAPDVPVLHTLAYLVGLAVCAVVLAGMLVLRPHPEFVLAALLAVAAVVTLTRADERIALPGGCTMAVGFGVRLVLLAVGVVLAAVVDGAFPRSVLWSVPALGGMCFGALLAAPSLADGITATHRALLIGGPDGRGDLVEALDLARHAKAVEVAASIDFAAVAAGGGSILEHCRRHRASVVLLCGEQVDARLVSQLSELQSAGIRVRWQADFLEEFCRLVPLADLNVRWFLFDVAALHQRVYRMVSGLLDVVVGLCILLALGIVAPLVALAIRLEGPGPILFSQERVGRGGRLFRIYKFRTMTDTPQIEGDACAAVGDARITRVGQVLRRSRLDELPQAWNLVRRDMSLIGPRPERPEFVERYRREIPFYEFRHILRPGLTGWAQVTEGYASDTPGTRRKLERDLYYLRRQSLRLDLKVLRATATSILRLAGR